MSIILGQSRALTGSNYQTWGVMFSPAGWGVAKLSRCCEIVYAFWTTSFWSVRVAGRHAFMVGACFIKNMPPEIFSYHLAEEIRSRLGIGTCSIGAFFNSQTSGVQKSKSSSITLSLFLTHPKNHQLQCFTLTAATPPTQNRVISVVDYEMMIQLYKQTTQ